jgi:hypothetical protein
VKHQWSLLRWIVDVAEIVNRHPQLNWEETYDIARAFAVTVKLDCALSLCAEFLGSQEKLPGFVLDRLGGEKFARMKERIVQAWFEPFSPRI